MRGQISKIFRIYTWQLVIIQKTPQIFRVELPQTEKIRRGPCSARVISSIRIC